MGRQVISDDSLQDAFNEVCKEAKEPGPGAYVVLREQVPTYMPWEGGTYIHDSMVHAYQWFGTAELAEAAREAVLKLAKEKTDEAREEHGRQCLAELEFREDRGFEPDWGGDTNGPSEFSVSLETDIPTHHYASRTYE